MKTKFNENVFIPTSLFGLMFGIIFWSIGLTSCDSPTNKEKVTAYQHWELTDSLIIEGIGTELLFHPDIPSNKIAVEATQGIVTLTGDVNNILVRDKAEEIAAAVKGVRGVVNYIDVMQMDISDEQLKDEIVQTLVNDPVTDKYEILVEVEDGKIQLTGTVDSWQEEQFAEQLAKSVRGVRAVDNKINFAYPEAPRPDEEIAIDIAARLHNDVRVDDALIDITVENRNVTLSGTIGSVTEKSRAISDAWVAGVENVNADDLEVEKWARDPKMRQSKYVEKTDDEIRLAVEEVFINDYRINNFGIDVEINDGIATLEGSVDNLRAKRIAEEDASNVVGVWHVENNLEVIPVEFTNNQALADQVRKNIELHPYLDQYNIRVDTDNGDVELYGVVGSFIDKKHAEDVAARMPGVITIENYLEVQPNATTSQDIMETPVTSEKTELSAAKTKKTDDAIKADIEKQLFWSPFVNEDELYVNVENGQAILTGEVDTYLERESAEKNALQGGALTVDNNIVVDYSPPE